MKKLLVLAALAIILASCGNKEEKGAIEFLKGNLKSPSSFELVSCETTTEDAGYVYDTIYHISAINAEYDSLLNEYVNVSSISYDSMRIYKRVKAANTKYHIIFDADNAMGAKLRGEENVFLSNDTYTMNVLDLIDNKFELESENEKEGSVPYSTEFGCEMKVGKWYSISYFLEFWSVYPESEIIK